MMRVPDSREYCHERLHDHFANALSDYDTSRRLQVLVSEFLSDDMIAGKNVLDVGCGLGHFSEQLSLRGANVTACDIGERLVESTRTRAGCVGVVADALLLESTFGANRFDIVVSSECIEHTPDPDRAIREMISVLKVGGLLSLSTPNRVWQPVVRLASRLRLRPFDGLENFSTFKSIRRVLEESGAEVVREKGLHLFPFQLPLHFLSRWCDVRLQVARSLMINLCVLAKKKS